MEKLTVIMLTALCLLTVAGEGVACSCGARTAGEHYDASSIVFVGRTLNVSPQADDIQDDDQVQTSILKIINLYKGSLKDTVHITSTYDAGCGTIFQDNRMYIVYAIGKDELKIGTCSGTTEIAEEDITIYEEQFADAGDESTYKIYLWITLGLIIGILIIVKLKRA